MLRQIINTTTPSGTHKHAFMQPPSSLSSLWSWGWKKQLETCRRHGNVVITTSSFSPSKNRPHSLLICHRLAPLGLFHPSIRFLRLCHPLICSASFSHISVIPHFASLFHHHKSTLFQLSYLASFRLSFSLFQSLSYCFCFPSTTSTSKSVTKQSRAGEKCDNWNRRQKLKKDAKK